MTQQNARGCYLNFEHDRQADWDFLAKWQPNVVRLMVQGNHTDPNSVSLNRIKRVHETVPDATILLRCWDVDDRNFEAHAAMVQDPVGEAIRQVDWWAKVFDRAEAANIPRHKLMAGLNNETGPEKDGPLYAYSVQALDTGTKRRVRLGVCVFSVGRPSLPGEAQYTIDTFAQLDNAILANNGAVLLHEYLQPEGMYAVWTDDQGNERKDYTYLVGRHLRWNIKSPIIIGEWGIDGILYNRHPDPQYGNSGWRNFPQEWWPERYADEYVECVRKSSPNVIGICPFISDFSDRKWASFDMLEAYGALIARKDQCIKEVAATQPTPPSTGTQPVTPISKQVYTKAPSNIRDKPSFDSRVLEVAPIGTPLEVIGEGGDWYQIGRAGRKLYVHKTVVQDERAVPEPTPAPDQPQKPPTSTPTGIIDPRVAQAILNIESGGRTHGESGKPLIRFEAHVFKQYLENDALWARHFRTDPNKPWVNQEWRRNESDPWRPIHTGKQADEYEVLEFAKLLIGPVADPSKWDAAHKSISMGAGQLMGFHHSRLGYPSAEAMFDAFQSAPVQTIGFLNFFLSDPVLMDAVRHKDWRTIAAKYNGAGAVDTYAPLLEKAYKELA